MPTRPKTPCRFPLCPEVVDPREGWCPVHKREESRRIDQNRGNSTERGYNARWRRARLTWLKRHPLCRICEEAGRITPATVVDHIVPHKGDPALFWDRANWQSLCETHHNRKTATEDGGFGRVSKN